MTPRRAEMQKWLKENIDAYLRPGNRERAKDSDE